MTRRPLRQKKGTAKAKRSKPAPRRSNLTAKPNETNSLRIRAQIAMLQRALLAADDDSLPHRAVCDYLKTLSQMAKAEGFDTGEILRQRSPDAHVNSDSKETDATSASHASGHPDEMRRQLQQAIHEIYGLSESASIDARAGIEPNAARNGAEP